MSNKQITQITLRVTLSGKQKQEIIFHQHFPYHVPIQINDKLTAREFESGEVTDIRWIIRNGMQKKWITVEMKLDLKDSTREGIISSFKTFGWQAQ